MAGVTGKAQFEDVDNNIVRTEEMDSSELPNAIKEKMQWVFKKIKPMQTLNGFEKFPPPQAKHREVKSAVSLLQRYMLQQDLSNDTWQHIDAVTTAVKANVAAKRI